MISLADLHCDTLFNCFQNSLDLCSDDLHVNMRHMCKFERYIQTFAHYIPEQTPKKWDYFLAFLQNSQSVLKEADISVFKTADDLTKKRLAVLSVEGGDLFDDAEQAQKRIRFLKDQGFAFFSMIYNQRNILGCGCAVSEDTGLTDLGKEVVSILEKNNIVLDVSHASYRSTEDILNLATRPVCATHSNAQALTAHRRNLSDVHLRAIANSGGLVGVNFYPPFLSKHQADISDVCRHLDYMIDVCGEDHVVFGCDLDGVDELPTGIKNLSSLEQVYFEMKRLGYRESIMNKIFFDNIVEFLKENFRR